MSKPEYDVKVTDGVTEYHKDGEKIAFLNEQGNLQATHGNAGEKADLQVWIDAQKPQDHEHDKTPPVEKGTARFAFSEPDAPVVANRAKLEPPAVPTSEPILRPGLGNLAPEYLWWAWHQPDNVFEGIYGKSKTQFEKDHGGYLDKVKNRTNNGKLP